MTDVSMVALADGSFRPSSLDDAATIRKRWKPGDLALLSIRKPRNGKFHRKFFALVNFLFEYWEPGIKQYRGMEIQKNIDAFRRDLTIAAGFHDVYVNAVTGELRLKPSPSPLPRWATTSSRTCTARF